MGIASEVIDYQSFFNQKLPHGNCILLGPGPHGPEYYGLNSLIEQLIENNKVLGVCLGHQLIASALGMTVASSQKPMHGQSIKIKLDKFWQNELRSPKTLEVQRYNSLAVYSGKGIKGPKLLKHQQEVMAIKSEQTLSYQFHPESVGTTCPEVFFRSFQRFLL